jgi:hypothetical protein
MRRSAAAILGVAGGMLVGALFVRRGGVRRDRVDLYYADGSMVSLDGGTADAERLLPVAREVLRSARP